MIQIIQAHGCEICGPYVNYTEPLRPLIKFSREGGLGRMPGIVVCLSCLYSAASMLIEEMEG